jgi:hypothetical protein
MHLPLAKTVLILLVVLSGSRRAFWQLTELLPGGGMRSLVDMVGIVDRTRSPQVFSSATTGVNRYGNT